MKIISTPNAPAAIGPYSQAVVSQGFAFLSGQIPFARMNEVYARYFPASAPARATVEAARLPRDVRVEIDCIASVE
jgi:2-iminobutanoate/2-iminopropanoate deaminase